MQNEMNITKQDILDRLHPLECVYDTGETMNLLNVPQNEKELEFVIEQVRDYNLHPITHAKARKIGYKVLSSCKNALHKANRSSTVQVPSKYRPSTAQVEILVNAMPNEYIGITEMMTLCKMKHRMTFRDNYVTPALNDGSLERKFPDQPNHPKQMYRLTDIAKEWKSSNVKEN